MKMMQQPLPTTSEQSKLLISTSVKPSAIYPKIIAQSEYEDKRKLLCSLKAPRRDCAIVSLIKGNSYQLKLKPIHLDSSLLYRTCIRLSLGRSNTQEEAELITNLSSILDTPLLEVDYQHSDLDESVLDILSTNSRANLNLIWSAASMVPSGELKLSLKFNCLSHDFACLLNSLHGGIQGKEATKPTNVDLFLLVKTFGHKNNCLVEQSHCKVSW